MAIKRSVIAQIKKIAPKCFQTFDMNKDKCLDCGEHESTEQVYNICRASTKQA